MTINGMAVQPVLTRLQFFLDINDFARQAEPRRISVYQARLGIILSYATEGAPTQVRLTWETFNDYAPFLRSVVYVYGHNPKSQFFKKDAPFFTWAQTGATPTIALSHVPKPKRPPPCSLPVISLGAGLSALLWVGVSLHQHRQRSLARWLLGVLPFVVSGVLCWPLGRVNVHAPFAAIPQVTDAEARDLSFTLLRNL